MRCVLIAIFFLSSSLLMGQQMFPLNSIHGSTKKALEIHVKNETGEKSFLKEHMPKDKIYLVSVWASWCGPCRAELNALQKVYAQWAKEYNFEFIAISIDKPTDHPKVFAMAKKMNWEFKILHDEYGYVQRELGISAIPQMYLVDQGGKIVYQPKGFSERALDLLENRISKM